MEELKDRNWYVNNLSVGNIIAFKVNNNMFSGKVEKISEEDVTVRTKNSSIYFIKKEEIVWVKNGSKWPLGIYNALILNRRKE